MSKWVVLIYARVLKPAKTRWFRFLPVYSYVVAVKKCLGLLIKGFEAFH